MTIATQILEITAIPDVYKNRMFFYGVESVRDALKIWRQGYVPFPQQRKGKGAVIPGRTYVSGSLVRAARFANAEFGAIWNKTRIRSIGRYAYVFIIGRENLVDIYPNEETVGRFIQKVYDLQYGHKGEIPLSHEAMDFLTYSWGVLNRDEQVAVIRDERDSAPEIGKRLLSSLPDKYILWILGHEGIDLANEGELSFRALFRIDRARLNEIDEEGSNFFEVAERVTDEDQIL